MKYQRAAAYGLAGLALLLALWLNFVYLFPVDVIKDAKLTVPEKTHKVGETVTAYSSFTKVRDAGAKRTERYVECKHFNNKFMKHEANSEDKPRTASPGSYSDVPVTVVIPVVPRPATCRIALEPVYLVWGIREFPERIVSNEFEVE